MLYNTFSFKLLSLFCKICSPPSVGSTFLKNNCKQSALINLRLGSLLGAFSPWVPLRRALIRQYQCCCHPCPGHFFHSNPFCTHYWLFIFAISLNLLCCFDFWCFLACFFLIFLSKLWKCAPRESREHIFATRFLATSCAWRTFRAQNGFETVALGGSFHVVLLQKHELLPTERKMTPLWKLCLASPVSRMHFGWDFHIFALDFVIICETRFPSRCRA